ncbi:MAG: hypothetical protein GY761_03225 [Hyphomicrobiales bacterium]|nr:hypothetical protein [Hyphomicrobiales bacterium]
MWWETLINSASVAHKGGGGGGGSNSKKKTSPKQGNKPVYPNLPTSITFSPYLPGHQEALAQQMSQGYGAPPQEYLDQMNNLYQDTTMPVLHEPVGRTKSILANKNWNKPDEAYTTGSFALDSLLGLPSAKPGSFT